MNIKEFNPFYNKDDPYQTHAEFLIRFLTRNKIDKPILELGCGYGTTPIFSKFCRENGIQLKTMDNNIEWIKKIKEEFPPNEFHTYEQVYNWEYQIDSCIGTEYSLVFADQAPWEARDYSIRSLMDHSDFLMLHDCDYFPNNNIIGKTLRPIVNSSNTGLRDYSELGCNYREYFPTHFAGPTGPPVLFMSKKFSCEGYEE